MKTFLAVLCAVVVIFLAVGFWQGWINFESSEDKATIDVHTREIEEDVQRGIDTAKEKGAEAVERIRRSDGVVEELTEDEQLDGPTLQP